MEHPQTHLPSVLNPGDVASPAPVSASSPLPPISPITEIRWRRRWEQIHDVDGSLWDVHEARATNHGFDLLFGFIGNSRIVGPAAPRKPRLIPTKPLVAYWDTNRVNTHAIFDLPVDRDSIKVLRRKLGFNFFKDRRALWQKRVDDMKNLTMNEFAQRYDVDVMTAYGWRLLLLGRSARPSNWWNTPETLAILQSPGTNREVAAKLGISSKRALELRRLAVSPPGTQLADELTRSFPRRWQTPATIAILQSDLSNRQVAKELAVSISHAQRLRRLLARHPGQATS